jgi:hypothetical protein
MKISPIVPLILGLLIFIAAGTFIYNFWGNGLSNSTENWGQVGDYFSMLINLVSTVVVSWLSWLVYDGQKKRDIWEMKIMSLENTPYLVFVAQQGITYHLINVGKGAAHKVIVAEMCLDQEIISSFKSYSIPAGGYSDINWLGGEHKLFCSYEDSDGKKFLVQCFENENSLIDDDRILNLLKDKAQRRRGISIKMA